MMQFKELLEAEMVEVAKVLIDKNTKYGNAALEPLNIFSKLDAIEQINIRIDDKLKRIKTGCQGDTEDAEFDLLGYLLLKRVYKKIRIQNEQHNF